MHARVRSKKIKEQSAAYLCIVGQAERKKNCIGNLSEAAAARSGKNNQAI